MRFPVAALDDLAASNAESLTSRVVWTTSGRKLMIGPSIATGTGNINAYTRQTKGIAKALGDVDWSYGHKSGRRCNDIKHTLEEFCTACGYQVKYRTFLRWFQHFLKFGECPAATSRRRRRHRGGRRATSFTPRNNAKLDRIIKGKPYLYLDEIQKEMAKSCNGKI